MSPQEPMVWQLQTRNKQEFPVAGTGRLRAVLSILYYILFGGRLEAGEIMAWGAECQVWGGGGVMSGGGWGFMALQGTMNGLTGGSGWGNGPDRKGR